MPVHGGFVVGLGGGGVVVGSTVDVSVTVFGGSGFTSSGFPAFAPAAAAVLAPFPVGATGFA